MRFTCKHNTDVANATGCTRELALGNSGGAEAVHLWITGPSPDHKRQRTGCRKTATSSGSTLAEIGVCSGGSQRDVPKLGEIVIMRYAEFRQVLGLLAHEKATDQFKIMHLRQHLIYHNLIQIPPETKIRLGSWGRTEDIHKGYNRSDLGDPYLAFLIMALQTKMNASFSLEPSDPGISRQPDLASIELHDVYEIKPDTPEQRKNGLRQLFAFKNLLQQGDREYLALQERYPSKVYPRVIRSTWREGTDFLPKPAAVLLPPPLGEIVISFSRPMPGLILWTTEGDQEALKKKVEFRGRYVKEHAACT